MSDLTTVTNVKLWLGITDSNSDLLLQQLVTRLSAYVINFLNRNILSATYTEIRDGNRKTRMRLHEYPVSAVSSLTVDGIAVIPSVDGLTNGFVFDQWNLYLQDGAGVFNPGQRNINVSYTAGYLTVPPDLEQLVIEIVGLRMKNRARIGLVSENVQGQQTTFSLTDFSADQKGVLDNYKRVVSP